MKGTMLKSLILFTFFLNLAYAQNRFTDADKERFLNEVKQELAEHKVENKGHVDLQIIKPGFYAELEKYLKLEKFTRNEMLKIKQSYENLTKNQNIPADKAEEAFYNFINNELNEINSKALEKIKEGNICNTWSCAANLSCAPDPIQVDIGNLKKAGSSCNENTECASSECVEEKVGSKKKICEDVYRCFRPLSIGESCMNNPVCGAGSCLPYNSLTSGIGECSASGLTCKSNNECCSNSCKSGICQENFICKDCVSKGAKPQRGQKCCEGLYQNEQGMCVPDVPPSVIRQVFNFLGESLISSAKAQDNLDDAAFLKKGAVDDGFNLKSGIEANKNKIENNKLRESSSQAVDYRNKKPITKFDQKSNFATCNINFRDDFYNALKTDGTFDLEIAMLGFDFVITGDSDKDYWTVPSVSDSSLYSRLNKIGVAHKKIRADTNKIIDNNNNRLTCMCLDVQGYDKIQNAEKKKYFESCPEYAKYKDPTTSYDELSGDASGLKAKRLIVSWTKNLAEFHTLLAVDNTKLSGKFLEISKWSNGPQAKWATATTRNFDLFKFSIEKSGGSVAGLGALVGALLAAGVIAILGGFATTSILSAWASAGIISATAVTGAGGLWMLASLKGAWITQRPEITDYRVAPRSYSCGKKQTCMEYTRTLVQPYNDVCNIHTSSNACLKAFVVVNIDNKSSYIVDPWIPAGVSRDAILKKQPIYTEKLEAAFKNAKNSMISKNPGSGGGGGKKGGASIVAESYLSEIFIDADLVGKYVPDLGDNLESTYFMDSNKVKLIKEAAKVFAIKEGFLKESETENLKAFADYAYENHFVWPKISSPNEISYPTAGLNTYLDFMANDVSGNLSAGLIESAKVLLDLNEKHLLDYQNTLKLYSRAINQTDPLKAKKVSQELASISKELEGLKEMNELLSNCSRDLELSQLSPAGSSDNQNKLSSQLNNDNQNKFSSGFNNGVQTELSSGLRNNDQAKASGISSGPVLSSGQSNFLKAVRDLRNRREVQLKALATYQKSMASSGNKERAAKMATISKTFNDRFIMRNKTFSGSSSGKSTSSNSESTSSNVVNNINAEESTPNRAYSVASYGPYDSANRSNSYSSNSTNKSSSKDESHVMNESSSEIAAREALSTLVVAIEARDSARKDKYESNDEHTLFEKVTNAYIRNYDKVLSNRKDRDVIDNSK